MRWWASLVCALALSGRTGSAIEPPAGPNIPGYERFYRGAETPEADPVAGGLLLIAELRCTACHEAPEPWKTRLSIPAGPDLTGEGSRRSFVDLCQIVEDSPQSWKPGMRMPAMFAPEADKDAKLSVGYYLASLQEKLPSAPAGDIARGHELYDHVGCAVCHGPYTHPASLPPDQPQEEPKYPYVAIMPDMPQRALVAFLLDPLHVQPDGRMPSSHLNLQEAADLAAYLLEKDQAQIEERTKDAARPLPAEAIAEGKKIFAQRGCANCHATGEELHRLSAPPLEKLRSGHGCLAAEPAPPAANFGSVDVPKIEAALAAIQAGPPAAFTPAQEVDWQFMRLNCYACHVRGNKGGPDAARLPYFTVNDSGIESLGEIGHLPPNLSHVGRKLTEGWLAKVLWGEGGAVRPYMNVRMPAFGRANTEALIPLLEAADKLETPVQIDTSGLLSHQRAEPGRVLMGTTGLSCVSCHGLKDKPSLGPPVLRLTHTVERLRPEYFKELLLDPQATQPGTVMPPLFAGRKKASNEIESIWTYLRELDGQPLPDGLLAQGDFELKPAEAGRPIVFRSFIETGGTHAIGVGFPSGLNACFDAKHCRWTLLWKGRFLDAMENWQDRMMKPIKALGTDLHEPPPETAPREFRGYRLEKDGTPVMLYTEAGEQIEDKLEPDPSGQSFVRTIQHHAGPQVTTSRENWKW
jgi:mono/diheme cytochrome c family protein